MTAVLSTAGQCFIGPHLAWSAIASPYGTAGNPAALLLWLSCSAQVFLPTAEFTHFFANHRRGSHLPALVPNREASA